MLPSFPFHGHAFLKDNPVEIKHVEITGNKRTRTALFKRELCDVMKSSSLLILNTNLNDFSKRLRELEVFDFVDVKVDVASVKNNKYIVNVVIDVKEVSDRPMIKVSIISSIFYSVKSDAYLLNNQMGSYVHTKSNNKTELKGSIGGAIRNPLGFAECANVSYGLATSGAEEFEGSLRVPVNLFDTPFSLLLSASSTEDTAPSRFSSYNLSKKSSVAHLISRDKNHKITAEFSFRDATALTHLTERHAHAASQHVISTAGPSTKASIKYTFTADTRDNIVQPTTGFLCEVIEKVNFFRLIQPPVNIDIIKKEYSNNLYFE